LHTGTQEKTIIVSYITTFDFRQILVNEDKMSTFFSVLTNMWNTFNGVEIDPISAEREWEVLEQPH